MSFFYTPSQIDPMCQECPQSVVSGMCPVCTRKLPFPLPRNLKAKRVERDLIHPRGGGGSSNQWVTSGVVYS